MGGALHCSQTSVLKQNNGTQNIVHGKNSLFHHDLLSKRQHNQSKNGDDGDSHHHKHDFREESKRNESQMLGIVGSVYSGGLMVEMGSNAPPDANDHAVG